MKCFTQAKAKPLRRWAKGSVRVQRMEDFGVREKGCRLKRLCADIFCYAAIGEKRCNTPAVRLASVGGRTRYDAALPVMMPGITQASQEKRAANRTAVFPVRVPPAPSPRNISEERFPDIGFFAPADYLIGSSGQAASCVCSEAGHQLSRSFVAKKERDVLFRGPYFVGKADGRSAMLEVMSRRSNFTLILGGNLMQKGI